MTEEYLEQMALDLGEEVVPLCEEDLELLFRIHQMACYED